MRITDASGNEIQLAKPIRVNDTGRGSYEVRYTPLKAGLYVVNVSKKNGLNAPTVLLGKSPYSMRVKDAGQLSDAPPPTEISSTSAKTNDGEETAQEEFTKFGAGNIAYAGGILPGLARYRQIRLSPSTRTISVLIPPLRKKRIPMKSLLAKIRHASYYKLGGRVQSAKIEQNVGRETRANRRKKWKR